MFGKFDMLLISIAGFCLGVILSIIANGILDTDWKEHLKKTITIQQTCQIANSSPESFDNTHVTCENGAVLEWRQ